jgi:VWFA-related protein
MIRTGLSMLTAAAMLAAQDSSIIRIDVNLVQVDAVVTDSNNKHVGNLKAGDFEILQDGKPQTITDFSYISAANVSTTGVASPNRAPALPAFVKGPVKREQVRRTMAFVVDDLGLSFESVSHVRDALRKFVNGAMQADDLVAIVRTSAGMGALQQFTTDRGLLNAAIDNIRFNVGRADVSSFAPAIGPKSFDPPNRARIDQAVARRDEARNELFLVGTLGALRFVIDGLREMPGRKSLILFSESFAGSPEALRALTDAANRAAVVVNTIDPRGLETLLDPRDTAHGQGATEKRASEMFDSQQGLAAIARDTGGLFMENHNLMDEAVNTVVADTDGYYLIGYHPDSATFDSSHGPNKDEPLYHKVVVRLKTSGLQVRSRGGFFGATDTARDVALTGRAALAHALTSPFSAADVHVRLTTLFTQTEDRQSRLTAMLHVDAHDLNFSRQPDGTQHASFEIAAMTLGVNAEHIDEGQRTFSLDLKPDQYEAVLNKGLVFVMNQKARGPGMYQMRVALHDQNSERLGSASEFVEVPDLTKGRLALSSILLRADAGGALAYADQAEGQVADSNPAVAAALRVFKPGAPLYYQYLVFNAQADAEHKTNLEVQTRLFRAGSQIYASQPMLPRVSGEVSSGRLMAGGHLTLATGVAPGEYVLQVLLTDKQAKEKYQIASQWIDFEVRP